MGIPDYLSAKYRELEEDREEARERILGYPVPGMPTEVSPRGPEEPKESSLDTQVGGSHYKGFKMQPIEIAYDYNLSPGLTLALRYILRDKDNRLQDLQKAKHCIELAIELEYGETNE